jgi:hypothetical protein
MHIEFHEAPFNYNFHFCPPTSELSHERKFGEFPGDNLAYSFLIEFVYAKKASKLYFLRRRL